MKPLSMLDPNSDRVSRGGGWSYSMLLARVAYRYRWQPSNRYSILGFRLYLEVR